MRRWWYQRAQKPSMVDSCLLTTDLGRILSNNGLTELPPGIFDSLTALQILCVKKSNFFLHAVKLLIEKMVFCETKK